VFYPTDPNANIDPEDAYPSVPGVGVAITNPPYLDASQAGAGQAATGPSNLGTGGGTVQLASGDQSPGFSDVADVTYDAAPWQTTRYLRVGNATRQKVAVYVRFLAETGPNTTAWIPAEPNDPSDQWAVLELEPGESVDLKQDDWQVNVRQACIWARSDASEWNQFRNRPLNLVADQQYQSAAPQVFNFTIR
jgi:hypothetical protein